MAWKEDAFQHQWNHLEAYTLFPFAIISRVLNKVVAPLLFHTYYPCCCNKLSPLSTSSVLEASGSAAHLEVLSKAGDDKTLHVEVIQQHVSKAIFHQWLLIGQQPMLRKSSASLYQLEWLTFCHWCHGRSLNPCKATVHQIAYFFCLPEGGEGPVNSCH